MGMPKRVLYSTGTIFQRRILVGLAISIILLCATGLVFYDFQKNRIIGKVEQTLSAISELKTVQLEDWRAQQIAEARKLMASGQLRISAESFLKRGDEDSRKDFLQRMEANKSALNADSVLFADTGGIRFSASGLPRETLPPETLAAMNEASVKRQSILTDLYYDEIAGRPFLDMVIPLLQGLLPGTPIPGFLIFRIDPAVYLYPLIQR